MMTLIIPKRACENSLSHHFMHDYLQTLVSASSTNDTCESRNLAEYDLPPSGKDTRDTVCTADHKNASLEALASKQHSKT